jgi:hypothetical protein
MNEMMLNVAEPREILLTVIDRKVPAVMSYLSKGKWHAVKVLLTELGANKFDIIKFSPSQSEKPYPINIRVDQPVGISLKYGYGKLIFETRVVSLEPSPGANGGGGVMSLAVPDRIEIVQRRSYFRIDVPDSLKVKVTLWHRSNSNNEVQSPPENYWQGRLVDISAGGAGVSLDASQKPDFKKGQFVGLRFTPLPYEQPLVLNCQVRNVLPTSDESSICLGLQIVGLETSSEGRGIIQRLCNVVERYYQMNRSGVKQQEMQPISS